MKARLTTLAAAVAAAAAVAGLVNPSTASAHNNSGVPYHTRPAVAQLTTDAGGNCAYGFWNPSVVLGFTREYVYWRPMAAAYLSGGWQYKYGEWRRALVTSTEMVFGWESQQWPFNNWGFSNGVSSVWVTAGAQWYVGYQLYYSSMNLYHHEWTSLERCYR